MKDSERKHFRVKRKPGQLWDNLMNSLKVMGYKISPYVHGIDCHGVHIDRTNKEVKSFLTGWTYRESFAKEVSVEQIRSIMYQEAKDPTKAVSKQLNLTVDDLESEKETPAVVMNLNNMYVAVELGDDDVVVNDTGTIEDTPEQAWESVKEVFHRPSTRIFKLSLYARVESVEVMVPQDKVVLL